MITKLLIAWCLMALCVVIHAFGVTSAVQWVRRQPTPGFHLLRWTWLFVCIAGWVILLHLLEITGWALFYSSQHAFPGLQTSLYFSAVTYTTTGYGDLVLPQSWRIVGGVEALTGILMCGWSTGFFLAVVGRMYDAEPRPTVTREPSAGAGTLVTDVLTQRPQSPERT